jgi:resuscitation-promoting factor RpfB
VRRSLKLVLFAFVLVGLVGGLVGFAAAQKSVTLLVDGQTRSVSTYAATVGEVLADEGVPVGEHDVVLPAVEDTLADGGTVVLNRARPLELTVDGVRREVYVTALSVDEALEQLGFRSDDLVLSASRSERLPLGGMALTITTPKDVVLVADGRKRTVTTTAATAADLLAEQGIALSGTDRLSLLPDQVLLDKMRLQVFRVVVKEAKVTAAVPFERVETADPEALEGEETVVTPGVAGEQVTTFKVTVVDGKETSREKLGTTVTRKPVTEEVRVGTKERPEPAVTADGLNWAAVAQCESGGNPRAVNPAGYYGLYQFSLPTWESVGGTGNPIDASPEEQLARAQMLYERSGPGQWGCSEHF